MKLKFKSSIGSSAKIMVRTKQDNVKIIISSDADETIQLLFYFCLKRYQEGLEESRKA